MSNDSIYSINLELDDLLIRYLTLLQDFSNISLETEGIMSRGFFSMAKSRQVMRPNSVFSSDFTSSDAEGMALITVGRSVEKDKGEEHLLLYSVPANERKEKLTKLRQKVGGFLTSNSLGQVQQLFLTALERNIQRANIQKQILAVMEKFKNLEKAKNEILAQSFEQ